MTDGMFSNLEKNLHEKPAIIRKLPDEHSDFGGLNCDGMVSTSLFEPNLQAGGHHSFLASTRDTVTVPDVLASRLMRTIYFH